MKDLQEVTERVCELKGSLIALDALMTALLRSLPAHEQRGVMERFSAHTEVARTVLLHVPISEHTINAFEHDVQRIASLAEGAAGS